MQPRHVRKLSQKYRPLMILVLAITLACVAFWIAGADDGWPHANAKPGRIPEPIAAPQSLLRARHACPNTATLVQCRGQLRRAYDGLAWAKKERRHRWAPTVAYAIALGCASQPEMDCGWFKRMLRCESGLRPWAKNRHSTAAGLAQFLDGTWSGNRYGRFSVFDPIANALGAAWLAVRNGHGPWYESRGCWS